MNVRLHHEKEQQALITLPCSKSLLHRACIIASLCEQPSHFHHVSFCDDTLMTKKILEQCGAVFEAKHDELIVKKGIDFQMDEGSVFDCHSSGSTLRFLLPLLARLKSGATFQMSQQLYQRPMQIYEQLFRAQGLTYQKEHGTIYVKGNLKPGYYQIPGSISSQFITGLLFVLPFLEKRSILEITSSFESKTYVDMSLALLELAGVTIQKDGSKLLIEPNQVVKPLDLNVEADYSAAAFFACLGGLRNEEISILNLSKNSLQGDSAIVEILKEMGSDVWFDDDDVLHVKQREFVSTCIDLKECIDLAPVLFAYAACFDETTKFVHTKRLAFKESNRAEAMKKELEKVGAHVEILDDEIYVTGTSKMPRFVEFDGHQDHRVIMALSILTRVIDGDVVIRNADDVNKSFPDFFHQLELCGIFVERLNDDENISD